jgi:hypothetical protein
MKNPFSMLACTIAKQGTKPAVSLTQQTIMPEKPP